MLSDKDINKKVGGIQCSQIRSQVDLIFEKMFNSYLGVI